MKIAKERGCVFYQWTVRCTAVLEVRGWREGEKEEKKEGEKEEEKKH